MLNPWLSSSRMAVRIQGLKGRHRTAQGNALGFEAIIAIKRCKRATILLLTQRHSSVVAQASKPAVSVLRYFQWNRATAIRCRGWSRGAHAPSRAAVDASSTAPTRASARGSRMDGNPLLGLARQIVVTGFQTCVPCLFNDASELVGTGYSRLFPNGYEISGLEGGTGFPPVKSGIPPEFVRASSG